MNILSNIFAGVVLFFGSIFAPHALAPTQKLGSVTPIQTQVFFLSGAGINNNATSVLLTSMAYSNGALVNMADLGTIGYATIDPGFPNKEEQVSFSNITQNSNGSALLTGVIRGLAFNPGTQGCNGSSTLAISHAGGAQFVLSNTACFYTNYAGLSNNNTFTASNTFTSAPLVINPSTNASATVTYAQLASTSFSGTVNAATSTKGIIQIATNAQIASGTATGSSGALLVEPNSNSSLVASTSIVSVQASGTLDSSFLSGGTYSVSQLTVTGTSSIPYIVPVGTIDAYVSSTAPTGWLSANGQLVSTSTYPNLFSLLGYTYGGSTSTFGMPNLTNRFLEGSSTSIGTTGGSSTATGTVQVNANGFSCTNGCNSPGGTNGPYSGVLYNGQNVNGATTISGNATTTGLPPYFIVNYIIKY